MKLFLEDLKQKVDKLMELVEMKPFDLLGGEEKVKMEEGKKYKLNPNKEDFNEEV